jgi:hypothetical protein
MQLMQVTSNEAAVMYARACCAWYGKRAPAVVARQIRDLKRRGDAQGVDIWNMVADRVSALHVDHKRPDRELRGKLY